MAAPRVTIQTADFDLGAEVGALRAGNAGIGAVASFIGTVRGGNDGAGVASMELEHYPGMTERSIESMIDAAMQRFQLTGARVIHRIGVLEPGAPRANQMAALLELPNVTHHSGPMPVAMFGLIDAMTAIFSGQCDTVLLYFAFTRLPWNSRSAAQDPFRRYVMMGGGTAKPPMPESIDPSAAYTAWASRYIHEFGAKREDFGRIALNMRANAAHNPDRKSVV